MLSQLFTACWWYRVKHIYLKTSLQFLSGRISHVGKKVPTRYKNFAFHISNCIGICQMPAWVRKTEQVAIFNIILNIFSKSVPKKILMFDERNPTLMTEFIK